MFVDKVRLFSVRIVDFVIIIVVFIFVKSFFIVIIVVINFFFIVHTIFLKLLFTI